MQRLLLIPVICLALNRVAAAEPTRVRVQMNDSRTVSGFVDTRTNDTHLRLSRAASRIRLTTRIAWHNIETVYSENEEWTGAEFRGLWPKFAAELPPAKKANREAVSKTVSTVDGRVSSIAGTAGLGRWNRRADADGLILNLFVLDMNGRQITTGGQLDVQLYGLRQNDRGGSATFGEKPKVLHLERWGFSVGADDFHDGALQVRLPFRRLRPEQAIDVADSAFLRVRFGVPSQGTFQVSLPDVFIRDYSLFRDELYQATGSRLLPFEKP